MQKISGLIGKQAITLADATSRGTILNVYFNATLTKCKYFTLICDEYEEVKWVAFKNLCSLNNDAVVIKSDSHIMDLPEGDVTASPINLPAFNQDGVLLGVVRDIELCGDKTVNLITDLKIVPINTLLSMSAELLVFNDSGEPLNIKKSVKKETGIDAASRLKSRAVIPSAPKKNEKQAYINHLLQNNEDTGVILNPENRFGYDAAFATQNYDGYVQAADFSYAQANEFAIYRQEVVFADQAEKIAETEAGVVKFAESPIHIIEKEARSNEEFTKENTPEKIKKQTDTFYKKDWITQREIQTPAKIPPEQTEVYRSPAENLQAESIQSRYSFLIGKRLQRPIYGHKGQLLAKENDLVNIDIILRAKENGKLVMLALHSL